jgi:hypothetical protein
VTIFIHHASLPIETELLIWDMFFIWGDTIIFSVSITLILLMEPEVMKTNDFGEIYQVVNSFGKGITPNKFLEVYVGNFN